MSASTINFIGGTGRSGTMALKLAFMQHPDCTRIHEELRFFVDPDGIVDFYSTFFSYWEPFLYDVRVRRLEKFLKQIGSNNFVQNAYRYAIGKSGLNKIIPIVVVPRYTELGLKGHCPRYFELVDSLMEDLADFRYKGRWVGSGFLQKSTMTYKSPMSSDALECILRKFLVEFIREVLRHQRAEHFFDSTPRTILCFDKLLHLLPESKLVHMYRDPRDVVASFTKASFAPADPEQAAWIVKDILDRWIAVRDLLPPASVKEVKLETLVTEPEHVLQDVCSFLNIDWDCGMLRADLSHAHAGRWRRDLAREKQIAVDRILAPHVERLGYTR